MEDLPIETGTRPNVSSYEKMIPDIRRTLVFSETFYSITLVLEADATVAVEE